MPLYSPSTDTTALANPSDHNLAAWTCDPVNLQASLLALGSGTLQGARFKVNSATLITNLFMYVSTGGITLTSGRCRIGLFTDAGALLSDCGDQSTAWSSTGLKTMPLAVPQAVSPWTWYKVAWYANGLTAPTFARGSNLNAAVLNAGMGPWTYRFFAADTGLTTALPAQMATPSAGDTGWWVAAN